MKKTLYIFLPLLILFSCSKEKMEIMDMKANLEDIARLELRADHYMLLPNGKARMEFFPVVYGEKTVVEYGEEGSDTVKIEYVIPNSQLPEGTVKIVDEKGNTLKDNLYSTSDASLAGRDVKFKAVFNSMESPEIAIRIRELPEEDYEEIVIPVIFHMLVPPSTTGVEYDISSEYLQSVLDRMNQIFNGKIAGDPNGGNAKITFKLALYSPNRLRMSEPGKNIIKLTASDMTTIGTSSGDLSSKYDALIVKKKKTCIWNPNQYLNIWLTKFSANSSTDDGSGFSYSAKAPVYMLPEYSTTSIPGLKTETKESYGLSDITEATTARQAGILVNYMAFLNPNSQSVANPFSLALPLGVYYGLIVNTSSSASSYPASDPDYCDDTIIHSYEGTGNSSVYKSNMSYKTRPDGVPLQYFTSFNCMEVYTRGSSITVDQAKRMRTVIKQCTNRQPIDPKFALTGEEK